MALELASFCLQTMVTKQPQRVAVGKSLIACSPGCDECKLGGWCALMFNPQEGRTPARSVNRETVVIFPAKLHLGGRFYFLYQRSKCAIPAGCQYGIYGRFRVVMLPSACYGHQTICCHVDCRHPMKTSTVQPGPALCPISLPPRLDAMRGWNCGGMHEAR
jgi:hypothetical protein